MPKKVKAVPVPTEDNAVPELVQVSVNDTTEVVVEQQPLPTETTVAKKTKKTGEKKSKKRAEPEVKQEVVVEETLVVNTEPTAVEVEPDVITSCAETGVCPVPPAPQKAKRVITKTEIISDLEAVFGDVVAEVKDKSLVKRVKQLKSDLVRLFKLRQGLSKNTDNPNSGFRKPVDVSPEMRKFLNLPSSELTRRLDITKRLCDYIKENNLQDQLDRRNIIPDATLRKLLSINESDPPLTYYSIQQKLKPHIIKV